MSDQKAKSSCCGSRNILVPDELVEHSAFLDKESGINDSDQLTRCQRYLKYIKDGEFIISWSCILDSDQTISE